LRHFCLEAECEQVREWFKEQGFARPEEFDARLDLARRLRELGNDRHRAADFNGAMMHALGALHCLDFSQARVAIQTETQKREALEALVPVLSNLSIVFLKRGDAYNSGRAADLGLERAARMPSDCVEQLRAKLLFRRGLAKGQKKDFAEARADLREAARLMPGDREVRRALENCKALAEGQKGQADDEWRGLLTETPKTARQLARARRCWRGVRAVTHEAWAEARKTGLLRLAVLLLGPVLVALAPALASRASRR